MTDYQLIDRVPTTDEHRALFEAVGWRPYTPQETETALQHTLRGVVAYDSERLIGMGRVIGDRGKFYYIQDFAVLPAYQGKGVGGAMMARLVAWIKATAPGDPFIGLFATEVAMPFYRKFGLDVHADVLTGMWAVLPGDEQA